MLVKIMMYKKGGLYGKKNNFCVVNCWDLPICDCLFANGESFGYYELDY